MDKDELKEIGAIFQQKIEVMAERFEQIVTHKMGVMAEDFQHRLDIVVEGHQMLSEKMDRLTRNLPARNSDHTNQKSASTI